MKRSLNILFNILKFILLIVVMISFVYIMFFMYKRLNKDFAGIFISVLPYILLLILFVVRATFTNLKNNQSLLYNFVCCFTLGMIGFSCYRAIFDSMMLIRDGFSSHINFNYFSSHVKVFDILIYGLFISDILLIFLNKKKVDGGYNEEKN